MGYNIIHNGEFRLASEPNLSHKNRMFRYGDGLFESIRVVNGKCFNLTAHISRIFHGVKALHIEIPTFYSLEYFQDQINSLIQKNGIREGGKVKLSIYRKGYEPTYNPKGNNEAGYLLEAEGTDSNYYKLNTNGKTVDLYNNIKKQYNPYSAFKHANAILYIMALVDARSKHIDEYLLLNLQDNIIEATSSNIFLVSNGVLYTPPISDGCVGGTMRMKIVNLAIENGIKVYETSITPQYLLTADELLLTNAIKGVQWVGKYREKRFFNEMAQKLISLLNENIAAL